MRIVFNDTTELQLTHPTTDKPLVNSLGLPMIAVIYGNHTPIFQDVMATMKENQDKDLGAKESREEAAKLLSICVEEFKNIELITENGTIDGNSKASCLSVFWIKGQVDKKVMDLAAFLDPSSDS